MFSVFWRSARDQRWQVIGFSAALALMAMLDMFIWPAYRDTLQNFEIPPALQAIVGVELQIGTPAGFLSAEYYSWITILLIVYVAIEGTGAIAGEESAGTMDLLLAQPVSRSRVVLEKALATVVGSATVIAAGYAGFAVAKPFVSMDVGWGDLAAAQANLLPITLFFYALSLLASAISPSRALAAAAVVALATAAYFVNALSSGIDLLRPLRFATPFYYYGSGLPLVDGINVWHVAMLLGLAAMCLAFTLVSFSRRDIATSGSSDVDVYGGLRRLLGRGGATVPAS